MTTITATKELRALMKMVSREAWVVTELALTGGPGDWKKYKHLLSPDYLKVAKNLCGDLRRPDPTTKVLTDNVRALARDVRARRRLLGPEKRVTAGAAEAQRAGCLRVP